MADKKKCPLDADHEDVEMQCGAESDDGYRCTRDKGHEKKDDRGHHAHITPKMAKINGISKCMRVWK